MNKINRKYISVILITFSAIVMILSSGCTTSPGNYAGRVNDRYITYEEYMVAMRNQFESHVLNTGLPPNETVRKELSDRAFNNIVEGIVFQEELRRHNITVSHREVIDSLTTNVPDLIRNSRQFKTDGSFDHQKYHNSLLYNDPVDLTWLVRHYTNIHIPREKLKMKIFKEHDAIEREVRDEFLILNSSAEATIITFEPSHFTDVTIHDREIRDFYNENRRDYVTEPYAKLQYIIFPLHPSRQDSLYTKTRIDSVYAELQDDTPFALLAGTVSDSHSSLNRGELPFTELAAFPSRIRNDLAQMELNEYTRPYAVEDGWVIYKLMARTRNMVKLREIFIRHEPSEKTREELYSHIVNIRELAGEIGLDKTAYEFDLEFYTTEAVTPEDPYLPVLGKSDRIVERAVNTDSGIIFEPVFHHNLQVYVLISVLDNQRLEYLPLTSVRDEIREKLHRERQHELARQAAEKYYRRFGYRRIIHEAEQEGFEVEHFPSFSADTYFPDTDPINLARAMFIAGRSRYVSRPVETEKGVFIGVVHELISADIRQMTPSDEVTIRNRIFDEKGDELFIEWLQERKDNARIRDWRSQFH